MNTIEQTTQSQKQMTLEFPPSCSSVFWPSGHRPGQMKNMWSRAARSLLSLGKEIRLSVTEILTGFPSGLSLEYKARIEEMEKDYQDFVATRSPKLSNMMPGSSNLDRL